MTLFVLFSYPFHSTTSLLSVGSALISLAYFCQMRLLRKDYVRSKPNGKFVSAVCKQLILFPDARLKYFDHFLPISAISSQLWKLFFLISKKNAIFSEYKLCLSFPSRGLFVLSIVLASPFREIALVSNDFVMNIII